jgi:hypothetical protein
VSKVVFAQGTELQIRVLSSFVYSLAEVIYHELHKGEKKRAEQTIAEQEATIGLLKVQLHNLEKSLQQAEQERQNIEGKYQREITTLLQKHVDEQSALQSNHQEALAAVHRSHQEALTALQSNHQEEKEELQKQLHLLSGRLEEMQQQKPKRGITQLLRPSPASRQTQPLAPLAQNQEQPAASEEAQTLKPAFQVENLYRTRQTVYEVPDMGTFYTVAYAAEIWGLTGDPKSVTRRVRRFLVEHPQFWLLSYEQGREDPYWYILDKAKKTFQRYFNIEDKTRKEKVS